MLTTEGTEDTEKNIYFYTLLSKISVLSVVNLLIK